jgi:hypothetical protein
LHLRYIDSAPRRRMLTKKRNDGEQAWAAFEAEALPHGDRLF